jgi:hypothetical protein
MQERVEMTDRAQQGTWQLRVVRGSRLGQSFVIDRAFAALGRDPSNDVVIDDPSVSRRHAQLVYQDGWFHIQDLGSANRVAVNGVPVQGSARIGPGDQIALSRDVTLVLEWIPASEQTAVMGDAAPTPPQGTRAPAYEIPTQQWQPRSTLPSPSQPPPPIARPQARQSAAPPPEQRERRGISGLTLAFVGCGALLFILAIAGIAWALVYTDVLPNPLELLGPSTVTPTVEPPVQIATASPRLVVTPALTQAPTMTSVPADQPTPTATATAPATATTAPTETSTAEPTPTQAPTETPVPPTETPVPPTDTATPLPPTPTSPPPPTATPTTPPPTPTATTPPTPLSINHVVENVACISKGQYRINFTIYVDGGTGQYFVYRDIESQPIYGPGPVKAIPYELTWGAGSSAVGTLVVRSGSESAESKFYVQTPDCSGF